jgi:hypothetical protein
MLHLGNERSKTAQGFKSFVHSIMLPQPYAASSLFAAVNNFTVGRRGLADFSLRGNGS